MDVPQLEKMRELIKFCKSHSVSIAECARVLEITEDLDLINHMIKDSYRLGVTFKEYSEMYLVFQELKSNHKL